MCRFQGIVQDRSFNILRRSSSETAFLRHLVDRGLNGVQLIISDACRSLMDSGAEYLPDARWQRCTVHFYRNVFSHVPPTRVRK
jgi:putative transposase